jgi:hypothetical protein
MNVQQKTGIIGRGRPGKLKGTIIRVNTTGIKMYSP